jgi:hypothetical protein
VSTVSLQRSTALFELHYLTWQVDLVNDKPVKMVVFDGHEYLTAEEKRLKEDRNRTKYWKKWGPYVSERQWATGELT